MSPTELAAVISAIATLIGALGLGAWKNGRSRVEQPPPPADRESVGRLHEDTRAEIRGLHQEARIANKESQQNLKEVRDILVRIEAKLDIKM